MADWIKLPAAFPVVQTALLSQRLTVPLDVSRSLVAPPPGLTIGFEIGVKAEVDNISMCDAFLGDATATRLPDDVRSVWMRLAEAPSNHLRAFKTAVSLQLTAVGRRQDGTATTATWITKEEEQRWTPIK